VVPGAGLHLVPPAHCRASPQAYTDELVELHRRLMALRERNVLQQVLSPSFQAWALVPRAVP
jgi:hypothetical protein